MANIRRSLPFPDNHRERDGIIFDSACFDKLAPLVKKDAWHIRRKQGRYGWVRIKSPDCFGVQYGFYDADEFSVHGYFEGMAFHESLERPEELCWYDGKPQDPFDQVYMTPHISLYDQESIDCGQSGLTLPSYREMTLVHMSDVPPMYRRHWLASVNGVDIFSSEWRSQEV